MVPPPSPVAHLSSTEALRLRVRRALARPATDVVVLVLVLVSVVLLVVELVWPLGSRVSRVAATAGDVLTAGFAIELTLRWWSSRSTARFLRTYWVDLIAVIPFVRAARLFRVLRVLRLLRAGVVVNRRLLWRTSVVEEGVQQVTMLLMLAVTAVVVGAAALSSAETGPLGRFQEAMWFVLYLFVSGEPIGGSPETPGGRLVTLAMMLGGLTIFGVFVGTVSAAMTSRLTLGWQMFATDFDDLTRHVVVCGWNRSGATLLRELFTGGARDLVVVLITEGERPDDLPLDLLEPDRFFHVQGDYTQVDVLKRVNISGASKAVLLTDDVIPRSDRDRDARTVLAALTIERMAPHIYTVAEVTSVDTVAHLRHAHVEEVIVGDWYAGVILGSAARNKGLVGVLDEILSHASGNAFHTVPLPADWVGRTAQQAREALHTQWQATLVSVHRGRTPKVNPPGDLVLEAGDQLVVLSEAAPRP